jgi:uncharacterized protein (TIGR02266 family)
VEHRRADRRYDRRLAVEVIHEGKRFTAHSRNVSLGGLFIETDRALPFGANVTVTFDVPGLDEPVEAEAQVRWSEPADEGRGGVGLRFAGLRAREVWALNKYFDKA